MPIYPYSFQLPPLNVQDIPNDGAPGEFLGISAGGVLDWLPVATGGGDMLKSENLSGLANYTTARTNIGLGTASTPTFANLTLTSPSLSSSAPVTISQTWNAVGQTFTAFKVNAAGTSDANSAAGSLLADFQLGGVSKAWVTKQGGYRASIGQFVSGNGIGFAGGLNTGFYSVAGEQIFVAANNSVPIEFKSTSIVVNSAATFGFGQVGVGADTILVRDSASGNTLALRNGAAAQTFNVYGTYTSASVYERMFMRYNGTALAFQVGAETLGATARPLEFLTAGTKKLVLTATGNNTATIYSAANITANILTLRNLSETAKFEFNLNASGNAGLYLGTNTLISEVGNSYFNGGNVGIGTTAPSEKLDVAGNAQFVGTSPYLNLKSSTGGNYYIQSNSNVIGTGSGDYLAYLSPTGKGHTWTELSTTRMMIQPTTGNVGIGTPSPTSKLHVAGSSSPTITIDNTNTTGYSQMLFKNTIVDGGGFWLNGSAQTGYGGPSSLNLYASTGPLAFHTASVTNALSIAQNGTSTHAGQLIFAPDNTYDIGATNANRPKNVFVAGLLQAGATGVIGFNTRSYLKSPSDGVMTLVNTAETDFNRLQLGGAADTFPAIARDGAGIKFTGAAAGSTAWIKVPPVAVSALPLAATAGAGARAFVNDASSPTFGSAVTGGGAVLVPVYSTGSAWHVG